MKVARFPFVISSPSSTFIVVLNALQTQEAVHLLWSAKIVELNNKEESFTPSKL